jgi:mycothiol synthase
MDCTTVLTVDLTAFDSRAAFVVYGTPDSETLEMVMISRPFTDPDDLDRLRRFLVDVGRTTGPVSAGFHVGDLLWGRYMYEDDAFDPTERIRIWEWPESEIVGFAWLHPPAEVELNPHPGHHADRALIAAMLDWADERRRALSTDPKPHPLTTSLFADDEATASVLASLDYARNDHPAMLFFTRDLSEPIPAPVVPEGFAIRSLLSEAEYEERVAIHQEVWHPSRVTVGAYRRLRTVEGYEPELDLVAVAPDGAFAAYAILWHDAENRTGEFEPVGARTAYRGRGLAKAVLLEGLRRLRDQGGSVAIVYTPESNEAARRLYESVGFRVVNRWVYWERPDGV